jgi:hypothetical protein
MLEMSPWMTICPLHFSKLPMISLYRNGTEVIIYREQGLPCLKSSALLQFPDTATKRKQV